MIYGLLEGLICCAESQLFCADDHSCVLVGTLRKRADPYYTTLQTLTSQADIPVVFDGIVCSTRKGLSNCGPAIANLLVTQNNHVVLYIHKCTSELCIQRGHI